MTIMTIITIMYFGDGVTKRLPSDESIDVPMSPTSEDSRETAELVQRAAAAALSAIGGFGVSGARPSRNAQRVLGQV